MSVTQKQIADRLGISRSLVALALGGCPRVAEETRQRVTVVAQELGYGAHSNSAARSLRSRRGGKRPRTHTVAVAMGDFFEGLPITEVPFYKDILRGMSSEARRRDLDLSFFSCYPDRIPRTVMEGGVDGVICLYSGNWAFQNLGSELPCPVLRVGDGARDEWTLRPDDQRGIRLATQHLIQLGHRQIGYLGDLVPETRDVMYKSRLEGYFQALQEGGLPVRNDLVEAHIGAPDFACGAAGTARLMERSPEITAIVCLNDRAASGAIKQLRQNGYRVPFDVSVTGFDDVRQSEGEDEVALTTVYFDRNEMGRRAVEAICEAVDDEKPVPPSLSHELLPVRLVERNSTSIYLAP